MLRTLVQNPAPASGGIQSGEGRMSYYKPYSASLWNSDVLYADVLYDGAKPL